MQTIPLNLDSVLLFLHNSKLGYFLHNLSPLIVQFFRYLNFLVIMASKQIYSAVVLFLIFSQVISTTTGKSYMGLMGLIAMRTGIAVKRTGDFLILQLYVFFLSLNSNIVFSASLTMLKKLQEFHENRNDIGL